MMTAVMRRYHDWARKRDADRHRRRITRLNIPSLAFDDREIVWSHPSGERYRLAWGDVVVIGFLTTDNGPWWDDWFLVFVDTAGTWRCAALREPWPGALELAEHVLGRDGVVLGEKGVLADRAGSDSVIVWPAGLAGGEIPEYGE